MGAGLLAALRGLVGVGVSWSAVWGAVRQLWVMIGVSWLGYKLERAGTVDATTQAATKVANAGGAVAAAAGGVADATGKLDSTTLLIGAALIGVLMVMRK